MGKIKKAFKQNYEVFFGTTSALNLAGQICCAPLTIFLIIVWTILDVLFINEI